MEKIICVVEDNDGIRELIEYLLAGLDCKVLSCPTVKVFREKMKNFLPNLIILDIMLPDGNGIDISAALKADESTRHIPVLLMSANLNNKEKLVEASAEDFISKPFDIKELLNKVQRLVA